MGSNLVMVLTRVVPNSSSSEICSLRSSSANEVTSSLSSSEVTNSGLRMVLFNININPKMDRDKKRRKLRRLRAKPLRNFI